MANLYLLFSKALQNYVITMKSGEETTFVKTLLMSLALQNYFFFLKLVSGRESLGGCNCDGWYGGAMGFIAGDS